MFSHDKKLQNENAYRFSSLHAYLHSELHIQSQIDMNKLRQIDKFYEQTTRGRIFYESGKIYCEIR